MTRLDTPTGKAAAVEIDRLLARLGADGSHLGRAIQLLPPAPAGGPDPARSELESLKTNVDEAKAALDQVRGWFPTVAPTDVRKPELRGQLRRSLGWLFVAAVVSLLVLSLSGEPGETPLLDSLDAQLGLLAFAVALAAYLQVVANSLKERLAQPQGVDKTKHWGNFWRVLVAEQMIVLVGIATLVRMVAAPLFTQWNLLTFLPQAYTDRTIVVALGVTIAYLARLHYRQWKRE